MSSARKDPVEKPIIQLRITLDDVLPAVWRRLLVPGDIRLSDLHAVFQVAMGWTDSHLHSFSIGSKVFGAQYEDHPKEELDEKSVTLVEALGDLRRFHYAYDFGDDWQHEIVIEDQSMSIAGLKFAVCLDGQRACPLEDCGGAWGYVHLLEVLSDPDHEEFDDMTGWIGDYFDPELCDLSEINVALQRFG